MTIKLMSILFATILKETVLFERVQLDKFQFVFLIGMVSFFSETIRNLRNRIIIIKLIHEKGLFQNRILATQIQDLSTRFDFLQGDGLRAVPPIFAWQSLDFYRK